MGPSALLDIRRVLISGLGSIGKRHLRLVREKLPDAQIMILRHGSCVGEIVGADCCTNSLDEAVAFKPDIAIIASPAPLHATQTMALAAVGAHILVEKPMATTIKDARAMVAATRKSGVLLQVGYNLRYLESLSKFRSALMEGWIGRVASVRSEVGQYLPDWRPGVDWKKSVSARRELGGGALLELSHELDYLFWIFGNVHGLSGVLCQQGGFGLDVEDTVHAVLQFESTMPSSFNGAPPVASINLDFIRRDTVRRCVAVGEEGTLTWDGIASQVLLFRPENDVIVLHDAKPIRDISYINQLNQFISRVEAGLFSPDNAIEGVAVMGIIEGIRRSHESGGATISLGEHQFWD